MILAAQCGKLLWPSGSSDTILLDFLFELDMGSCLFKSYCTYFSPAIFYRPFPSPAAVPAPGWYRTRF